MLCIDFPCFLHGIEMTNIPEDFTVIVLDKWFVFASCLILWYSSWQSGIRFADKFWEHRVNPFRDKATCIRRIYFITFYKDILVQLHSCLSLNLIVIIDAPDAKVIESIWLVLPRITDRTSLVVRMRLMVIIAVTAIVHVAVLFNDFIQCKIWIINFKFILDNFNVFICESVLKIKFYHNSSFRKSLGK